MHQKHLTIKTIKPGQLKYLPNSYLKCTEQQANKSKMQEENRNLMKKIPYEAKYKGAKTHQQITQLRQTKTNTYTGELF